MLVYPLFGSSAPADRQHFIRACDADGDDRRSSSQTHGADPAAVAATLALLVGGAMIAASLLRLGFLANFISLPVLIGFMAGVGIVIVVGQLKSLLGVQIESKTTLGTLLELPACCRRRMH